MAKYSDIKGFTVQTLSSDTIASAVAGGTWASGGTMNTARSGTDGGTGTQTAAMLGGGAASYANSEQYDGSSWTEVADLNTGRGYIGGAGTTTAMVTFGGNPDGVALTELWNGSAWTEVADLNTGRQSMGACGATSTAALCISGADPSRVTNVESWNGSAWTELNDISTARGAAGGGGTSTATLVSGGNPAPGGTTNATEEFSFPPPTAAILTEGDIFLSGGTTLKGFGKAAGIPSATWASGGSLNTGHTSSAPSQAGTQTAAMASTGGNPSNVTNATEKRYVPWLNRFSGNHKTTR